MASTATHRKAGSARVMCKTADGISLFHVSPSHRVINEWNKLPNDCVNAISLGNKACG